MPVIRRECGPVFLDCGGNPNVIGRNRLAGLPKKLEHLRIDKRGMVRQRTDPHGRILQELVNGLSTCSTCLRVKQSRAVFSKNDRWKQNEIESGEAFREFLGRLKK